MCIYILYNYDFIAVRVYGRTVFRQKYIRLFLFHDSGNKYSFFYRHNCLYVHIDVSINNTYLNNNRSKNNFYVNISMFYTVSWTFAHLPVLHIRRAQNLCYERNPLMLKFVRVKIYNHIYFDWIIVVFEVVFRDGTILNHRLLCKRK